MHTTITTSIDRERCNGCGLCVKVCPDETLTMVDGKAAVTGDRSLGCAQCAAVCPVDAVTVGSVDPDAWRLKTVEDADRFIPFGQSDPGHLVSLMKSRRSCRVFKAEPLDREVLEDLVKIGTTAPTGTNSQLWTFTVYPDRAAVMKVGDQIANFFRFLNRLVARWPVRVAARLMRNRPLIEYYEEYYEASKLALKEYEETGRDRLFHGAPAVIIIGARPGASCPAEDALLATQNILLAAHAMGLGTCLIGFAVEAIRNRPQIKKAIGIPMDETVYSVIALGRPGVKYTRPAGRRSLTPRFVA